MIGLTGRGWQFDQALFPRAYFDEIKNGGSSGFQTVLRVQGRRDAWIAPAFRPALPDEILVGNEFRLIGRGHGVTMRADSALVRAPPGWLSH